MLHNIGRFSILSIKNRIFGGLFPHPSCTPGNSVKDYESNQGVVNTS